MQYPIKYKRLSKDLYSARIAGEVIGKVRRFPSGWLFISEERPVYISEQYAPCRDLAVAQWPGLDAYRELAY